jgi:hypothetical protein
LRDEQLSVGGRLRAPVHAAGGFSSREGNLRVVCVSACNVAAATYLCIISVGIVTVELGDVEAGAAHVGTSRGKYCLIVDAQLGLSLVSLSETVHQLV